ncbi:hypothetical protein RHDE110596_14445 [Prescottella defluvii]
MEPLPVRLPGRQVRLDLVVGHDAPCRGVDQEHMARLEAALRDHIRLGYRQDPALAREHHTAIAGVPPPARTKPVAVEDRAHDRAVGERHAGRAVPRLHQRRVELVERTSVVAHRRVVLPRLRDHHQHRVRQRPAPQVQQLENLVERRRVRRIGSADRKEPFERTRDEVAAQHRLPRTHPVPVPPDRIDLPVVRDVPERMRQRPGRERVGREATVHERDRTRDPPIPQIREVQRQLGGRQHALERHRPTRQRREVHAGAGPFDLRCHRLGALAQPVHPSIQIHPGRPDAADRRCGHEEERHVRHAGPGRRADIGPDRIHPYLVPTEDLEILAVRDRLHPAARLRAQAGLRRQEADSGREGRGPVRRCRRKFEINQFAQEVHRKLDEDSRTVTAVDLGARGPTMLEILEGEQRVRDDRVRAATADVGDHRDTARVRFPIGDIQATGIGLPREQHRTPPHRTRKSSTATTCSRITHFSGRLPPGGSPTTGADCVDRGPPALLSTREGCRVSHPAGPVYPATATRSDGENAHRPRRKTARAVCR